MVNNQNQEVKKMNQLLSTIDEMSSVDSNGDPILLLRCGHRSSVYYGCCDECSSCWKARQEEKKHQRLNRQYDCMEIVNSGGSQ